MMDFMLIAASTLSTLSWAVTYIRGVLLGKNELPAVITSTCFTLVFFIVAIAWGITQ